MLVIGAHLSITKGYEHMALKARSIDANTFQFFTRSPRGGQAKPLNIADVDALTKTMKEYNIPIILAHAPYVINLASKSDKTRNNSYELFEDDIVRLNHLPNNMYNFHPGSHVGQGVEKGIELIVDSLNNLMTDEMKTTVLLETMAGKGTEIGQTFEELQSIIEKVELQDKIGICFDTCHVYDAGYDIRDDLDGVLDHFDDVIGLDRLKAIHLNDSIYGLGSHKDRHARIGEGKIGQEALVNIINDKRLCNLPFYLETPNDIDGYKDEIDLLREHYTY